MKSYLKSKSIIDAIAENISTFDIYDQNSSASWFDPEWMFGKDLADGFDIVIGNPPFISNKDMHKLGMKDFIKRCNKVYKSAEAGNYDIYILFIEKGLFLLKKKGTISFITPNKFIIAKYSSHILKLISKEYYFRKIADFSTCNIFENASVYPLVIFIENIKNGFSYTTRSYMSYLPIVKSLQTITWDYENHKPIDDSNSNDKLNLVKKIERAHSINNELLFSPGINGFQFSNYAKCVTEGKKSNDAKRLIVTGSIDKYRILNKKTRYKGRDFSEPFINNNKQIISKGKWELFCSPKIVIAGMTKNIEATLDLQGIYAPGVSVYSILGDIKILKYVIGILNSNLMDWYFKIRYEDKHLAGGYISMNSKLLEKLPLKKLEIFTAEKISKKVLEILDDQNDYHSLYNELDLIIYKSYELEYNEITIIDPNIEKIISREDYEKIK